MLKAICSHSKRSHYKHPMETTGKGHPDTFRVNKGWLENLESATGFEIQG